MKTNTQFVVEHLSPIHQWDSTTGRTVKNPKWTHVRSTPDEDVALDNAMEFAKQTKEPHRVVKVDRTLVYTSPTI